MFYAVITVEPPIRDPLRWGRPLYKGHLFQPNAVLFDLRDRDDLSTRDKIVGPIASLVQRFHCIIIMPVVGKWADILSIHRKSAKEI